MSARAVTRVSGPVCFWSSPMARARARRALARAVAWAWEWVELRKDMLESVSSPTAITVSRISSESVMISAKPRLRQRDIPLQRGE